MPKKIFKKRKFAVARKKRRYKSKLGPTTVAFPIFNTPRYRKIAHRAIYRANLDPDGTGVLIAYATFRANDINQPTQVPGGDRPLGYDQMAALYLNWYVEKSSISVQYVSTATVTDLASPNVCAVMESNASAPNVAGGLLPMVSQANIGYSLLQSNTSGNVVRRRERYDPKLHFGIKDPADDAVLVGNTSTPSGPFALAYYHVIVAPLDDVADTAPVACIITITYDVVWNNPREIVFSSG